MNLAALLLLSTLLAPREAPRAEPMAVAPLANLNRDASLAWLEQGAAETMVADLRRAGVAVVERAAIAQAIAEVERAGKPSAGQRGGALPELSVATAVAAGKMVGARALVLGSFQVVGDVDKGAKGDKRSVRLVARVVDVETGAVQDAAKVTGTLDDIFTLQDQIVASLTARAAKKPPVRKVPAPRPAAYVKFGESLAAKDDVERQALLEQALVLDDNMSYAADALGALETRLREAADRAAVAFDDRERQLLAIVGDKAATADRRTQAARALLELFEKTRRFRALSRAADAVLDAKLPSDVVDDINERASWARVLAWARLVRVDKALGAGEKHLAAFPAGAHRADVEKLMRDLVEERRTLPDRQREYDEELTELAADIREAGARIDADRRLSFDWKRCIAAKWSRLPDLMLRNCSRFLDDHGRDPGDDARDHTRHARAYLAWARAMKGDFDKANTLARALEADTPGALDTTGLRDVIEKTWSAD